MLWEQLKDSKLGEFAVHQYRLLSFIVDFYFPRLMLVVEVDGRYHDFRRRQDNRRSAILRGEGIVVLRVRNESIDKDLDGVLERIRDAAKRRADAIAGSVLT